MQFGLCMYVAKSFCKLHLLSLQRSFYHIFWRNAACKLRRSSHGERRSRQFTRRLRLDVSGRRFRCALFGWRTGVDGRLGYVAHVCIVRIFTHHRRGGLGNPYSGVQGQSPGRWSADDVPQKLTNNWKWKSLLWRSHHFNGKTVSMPKDGLLIFPFWTPHSTAVLSPVSEGHGGMVLKRMYGEES